MDRRVILAVIATLGFPLVALGSLEVSVKQFDGGTILRQTDTADSGAALAVTVRGDTAWIQITTTSSNDDIGVITLDYGPADTHVAVSLGTAYFDDGRDPSQTVGRDFKGLVLGSHSSMRLKLYGKIGRDFPVSGTSGSIVVYELKRFDAVGVINGLVQTQIGTTDVTKVVCQKIGTSGTIRAITGDIKEVHTTGTELAHAQRTQLQYYLRPASNASGLT